MTTLNESKKIQEDFKNLSDVHMQDYLENFRKSVDTYNESFTTFAGSFVKEIEKSRDVVLKNIKVSLDIINKRIKDINPLIKKDANSQIEELRRNLIDFVTVADDSMLLKLSLHLKDVSKEQ